MPICDGMRRRYDAIGLTDGYIGAAEYEYVADPTDGHIVIFADRTGIRQLPPPISRYASVHGETVEEELWKEGKKDESAIQHHLNSLRLMMHHLGRTHRSRCTPEQSAAWWKHRASIIESFGEDGEVPQGWLGTYADSLLIVALVVAATYFCVWFTNSERRIPVKYAKRVVGRKMYGGQSSNLPLKLNMSGVMPIIFANAIVTIPATIAAFANRDGKSAFWNGVTNIFNVNKPLYIVINIGLLIAFAFFYIMISFNPVEVANNIQNNGGAIPGRKPGRPTREYIQKVLNRVTFLGALFLCIIAGVPMIMNAIVSIDGIHNSIIAQLANVSKETVAAYGNYLAYLTASGSEAVSAMSGITSLAFSGSSLLIVIGVALETIREIEAHLTMRNYKGFLD